MIDLQRKTHGKSRRKPGDRRTASPRGGALVASAVLALAVAAPAPAPRPASPIEMSFTFRTGQPIVQVQVNGGAAVPFVIDTGASVNVVDPAVLPADVGGQARRGFSGGGQGEVAARDVEDLTLATPEVTWSGQSAVATVLGYPDRKHFAGLIGAPVLMRYAVELRFAEGKLRLHDPARYRPPAGAIEIPFELMADLPVIRLPIEVAAGKAPVEARLMVDTGAGTFIDLNRPFVERHRLVEAIADAQPTDRTAGIGTPAPFLYGTGHRVVFAGKTFDRPRLGLSRATSGSSARSERDGILGTEVLRHFRMTVDYRRKVLVLERL